MSLGFVFVISLNYCTLDARGVRTMCVYLLCRLDYALLCCYTPLFNPSVHSPLNHIAKTVFTIPTTVWFDVRTDVMIKRSPSVPCI